MLNSQHHLRQRCSRHIRESALAEHGGPSFRHTAARRRRHSFLTEMLDTNTSGHEHGAPSPHWTVKSNYRLRTWAFIDMFFAIGFHAWGKGHGIAFWCLLASHLLLYPHVVFRIARRSARSLEAEVNNLTVDCLLFGVLMSALRFPLWITFTVYMASTLNLTISRGLQGLLRSQLAFVIGALIGVLAFGWKLSPNTDWPATWLCVLGNAVYLSSIGLVANARNQKLRHTREALKASELALHERLAEIQALRDRLQEQAVRDPLTGLHNRRYLEDELHKELARCGREKLSLAVMMIDVDHFKRVNDTYGHPGGDQVLKALGALLCQSVRASDSACRYGGEEFVCVLPGIEPDIAFVRADQWRKAFSEMSVQVGGSSISATISIGIALYPTHGESMSDLMNAADLALYEAKRSGRNCVVIHSPAPQEAAAADSRAQEQVKSGLPAPVDSCTAFAAADGSSALTQTS